MNDSTACIAQEQEVFDLSRILLQEEIDREQQEIDRERRDQHPNS